jgi:putative ABC transport system substrate-binding protein
MQFDILRRRDFVALLGGAVISSLAQFVAARAQQPSLPELGFLNPGTAKEASYLAFAFLDGVGRTELREGRHFTIQYRWADGDFARLPNLAMELVRRPVAVICAGGTSAALAAKSATASLPIVFVSSVDPIEIGLVSSFNRPGANLTGFHMSGSGMNQKRVQLMHEMIPAAVNLAVLVNQTTTFGRQEAEELRAAGSSIGLQVGIFNASTDRELDTAFAEMREQKVGGLLVQAEPFFLSRRVQLVLMTTRHAIPTMFPWREAAYSGGLSSYGPSLPAAFRAIGVYAGRILKGEKPADLPVQAPTRYELVINLKAARALGLDLPATLLVAADEVIE